MQMRGLLLLETFGLIIKIVRLNFYSSDNDSI